LFTLRLGELALSHARMHWPRQRFGRSPLEQPGKQLMAYRTRGPCLVKRTTTVLPQLQVSFTWP